MTSLNLNICQYCGKKFSRKILFTRHVILCELMNKPKTKRELDYEREETPDVMPTIEQ